MIKGNYTKRKHLKRMEDLYKKHLILGRCNIIAKKYDAYRFAYDLDKKHWCDKLHINIGNIRRSE